MGDSWKTCWSAKHFEKDPSQKIIQVSLLAFFMKFWLYSSTKGIRFICQLVCEMSMDSPSESQDDIFAVCKENTAIFFNEIEKSSPRYVQSAINLHQKNIEAWKNVINSTIAMEQEYAKKAGLKTPVPEATKKSIRDFTEGVIKAYAAQNEIVSDAADATNRAINALDENAKSFAALNKNMLDSMLLVINQQKKT